jgi:hypothetical protein
MPAHPMSEKSHSLDGTKTMGQINRELQEVHDAQPATARCAWCPWTFEGTAAEARDAFAFHKSSAHPDKVNGEPVAAAPHGNRHAAHWTRERIVEAIQVWAHDHDNTSSVGAEFRVENGLPNKSTVNRVFGNVGNAIVAAGFERPTQGRRRKEPVAADPPPAIEKPKSARRKRSTVKRAGARPPARRPLLPELLIGDGRSSSFIENCELAAARHESAAAAYREIAGGVRALEELAK